MKKKFNAKGVGAGLVSARKERGITLIALVITIIVLLILAGVTIAMVVGDNGILNRARQAKTETEKEEAREKVQVAVAGSYELDGYNVEKINKELGTDIENLPAIVEQNSYKFTIAKDGNVYDGECFFMTVNKENYGEYVDYGIDIDGDEDTTNDWRIFYRDEENVYLIASDYIEYNMAPKGKNGTPLTQNDIDNTGAKGGNYQLSMNDVIKDYEGAKNIDNRLMKWLSYLNSNEDNINDNMKAVAYMLDTSENVWGSLANDKAEYAIGGPTLDMFCKSYNETHAQTIEYRVNSNNIGYEIKQESDADWSYHIDVKEPKSDIDNMYFIHNQDKTGAIWIAAPSSISSMNKDTIYNGWYNRSLSGYDKYDRVNCGFRPIICLKSNVQAQKDGEIWKLQ